VAKVNDFRSAARKRAGKQECEAGLARAVIARDAPSSLARSDLKAAATRSKQDLAKSVRM
jgi:hypothetical protein